MFLITHVATPIIVSASVDLVRVKRLKTSLFSNSDYLIIGFCSLIPDMFWPDAYGPYRIGHTISHSFVFVLLVYLGILFITWIFNKNRPSALKATIFWLSCFSHLVLDAVSGGKKLFYPFSDIIIGGTLIPTQLWFIFDIGLLLGVIIIFYILRKFVKQEE